MKDDLRQATDIVVGCNEFGEVEYYIGKCALTKLDRDILYRKRVLDQSFVQISMELNICERSAKAHYRKAMLILRDIVRKYKK
jgi:hypothetical protein